ncbi:MAG TPA: hypothetical protein VH134_03370 [Candidatus Dormibacteraeota bacterium]|nr:hypothetical protein [Candidatus Dormibacteraeota bacterium]
MRLTRRPEVPDDPGGQVERLREAVEILHRVIGITDRSFREAVVDGYVVLPPPLRERVSTTVSPEILADYRARIAELSDQAARLREWAQRLPQAGVVVPDPQPLDPVRLLALMRGSWTVPGTATPAAAPPPDTEATVAATSSAPGPAPDPPIAEAAGLPLWRRPLAVAGALIGVAAVIGAGTALLRPTPPAARAHDAAATTTAAPVVTTTAPPLRRGEAVAAGPGSQLVVLFGGVAPGSRLLDDTWVFDGRRWLQVHPGASPPARSGGLAAYDGARHQVVLTGGQGAGGALTDTWTWDGVGWTLQLPETPPRLGPWSAMAADTATHTTVLVTGRAGAPAQTWLWDGQQWSAARAPAEPLLTGPPVVATDPLTGHPLLVTAVGPAASPAATWSWDGRTWTQRRQGPPVAVRPGSTWMAADTAAQRVLLFETGTAGGTTWLWNGRAWSYVFSAVAPAIGGDGVASGLITDPVSGRPLLVGAGSPGDPSRLRRSWHWHGDGWRPG